MMRRYIIFAAALAVTASLMGCRGGDKEARREIPRQAVTGVTTMKLTPVSVDSYYETSGTIRARTVSAVAARVTGAVTSVKIAEGDRVKTGDILMTIDDRDTAQRVTAAQAAFNEAISARDGASQRFSLAEVTYRRYRNLLAEKVVSGHEFDQIETERKVAEAELGRATQAMERGRANLEEARIQRGYGVVRAPISGIVTGKKIETGSLAMPGTPLCVVEDDTSFKMDAHVDGRLVGRLSPGMTVVVLAGKNGEKLAGRITRVVPAVDPVSRTFPIEIAPQGSALRSGLYGQVLIPDGKRDALLVPVGSVVERGQLTGVFVVDDRNVVTYRLIKTGKVRDGQYEILSGLTKGEEIIISGIERAVDGGIVRK